MSRWSVIGDGVSGLCVATALAERGQSVEVIVDESRRPASHWAGGMLAPWCEGESAPDEVTELGQRSAPWWAARVDGVQHQGTLVVAPPRDAPDLNRFARVTHAHQWVDPGELEPHLQGRFARGLFFAGEAHLNPRDAMNQLRDRLQRSGVAFHSGGPTGRVIDCRGIHAADALAGLRGVRGEMLILQTQELQLSRPVRLLHPRFPCYLVPRASGHFMLGATMVESDDASPISARAMMELLSAAWAIHPALAEARIIESGTGLRPSWPDNVPAIRHLNGRWYVNGMYRHGFLLAPVMAEKLMQHLTQDNLL
ncbi:FAD-dependent oxidoreductase (plasmid) [Erwinia sp. E602]|uniref:FAD-dependent oxidoreductase n=1 Tax=unclassified Erwinia TaxID=2622719 RepID=UPI0006FCC990|nr:MULTISPECIES: FAD-dependent oxidoreductase [unclassified Erwinia]KQN55558.1 thiamine biosynthesis protein thio [Erwinia sp. Leaf53]PLV63842.1 thiamine biosynthesis protein thio [Erwinia sp. B116]QUG73583.1 FAD-dependent oxidoreductase [Erwinia sp. E602]